jgi:hypothetical protein
VIGESRGIEASVVTEAASCIHAGPRLDSDDRERIDEWIEKSPQADQLRRSVYENESQDED